MTFTTQNLWTVAAVLGRMYHLEATKGGTGTIDPWKIKIILSAGVQLQDFSGATERVDRPMTAILCGDSLGRFLQNLHEHGEAVPERIFSQYGFTRWTTNSTFRPDALRLSSDQVFLLWDSFDIWLRDLARGHVHPLTAALVEHAYGDDLSATELTTSCSPTARNNSIAQPIAAGLANKQLVWTLAPMDRANELRVTLYNYLKTCDQYQDPPSARAILAAWCDEVPTGVVRVEAGRLEYVTQTGKSRPISLKLLADKMFNLILRDRQSK